MFFSAIDFTCGRVAHCEFCCIEFLVYFFCELCTFFWVVLWKQEE